MRKSSPEAAHDDIEQTSIEGEKRRKRKSDITWVRRLKELQHYKAVHGNCLVPARYKDNKSLGYWVMTQRRQFVLMQEGKPSSLTKKRVMELEMLGFTWAIRPSNGGNKHEDHRLDELKQYKEEFDDCNAPESFWSNHARRSWIKSQRRDYSFQTEGKKLSRMTEDRLKALDDLGFECEFLRNEDTNTSIHERNTGNLTLFKKQDLHCHFIEHQVTAVSNRSSGASCSNKLVESVRVNNTDETMEHIIGRAKLAAAESSSILQHMPLFEGVL